MNAFESSLLWLTNHGYQILLAGLVIAFLVRKPQARRAIVRAFLIFGGIVVGAVFIAAAYGKMKPPAGFAWSPASLRISLAWFAMQVDSYQVLPPRSVNAVAHFLPYFELFLGLWLITGIARRFSALLASLSLCGFMIAITSAYFRGLKIDCGCGVGPAEQVGPDALLRDALKFLLPALLVAIGSFWIRGKGRASESPAPEMVSSSAST